MCLGITDLLLAMIMYFDKMALQEDVDNYGLFIYSAVPIYHRLYSPNNSRGTLIARPLGRGMGVFRKILV